MTRVFARESKEADVKVLVCGGRDAGNRTEKAQGEVADMRASLKT